MVHQTQIQLINMKKLISPFSFMILLILPSVMWSQYDCSNWNENPRKQEGEEAHSIYRSALRSGDLPIALENWQIAFNIAPAADGKRDYHLTDGIEIYKQLLSTETDESKKKEYKDKIVDLYKHAVHCYRERAFTYDGCDEGCYDQKTGFILGRMGYDLFYTINAPYDFNYEILNEALNINDKTAEYIVLEPLANIAIHQYKQNKLAAEDLRLLYQKIDEIGDYNVENDPDYGEYYDISRKRALAVFKDVEDEIFDCAYFKEKYIPIYEESSDDLETVKQVVVALKKRGCTSEDPEIAAMERKYEEMAASFNAAAQAEYEKNNPQVLAKRLYDSGDYKGAIEQYNLAIQQATGEKKATYLFAKASIEGRKLGSLGAAKTSLKEASELRPDWGRPLMLLGDLYALQARNCGDPWQSGLAVIAAIEQYSRAKAKDPSVAGEASSRIAKYQSSKPDQGEAFMQGLKAGDRVSVGCGIGETVSLSFR